MTDQIIEPVTGPKKKRDPIPSPSGKYVLSISSKETKPGCWNYTTGEVAQADTGEVIKTVERNYSSFPFAWVEGHPNGHDYLVCGADYQGQTVIELDTGGRLDFLPEDAKQGHGFCWSVYEFNREHQMMVVDGCIWAAPYEFRFYDFSDPMSGWPEIVLKDDCIYSEDKQPTITSDGRITCYDMREVGDADPDSDEDPKKEVVATRTFQREGLELRQVGTWISDAERIRREENAAARKKYEEEWEEYKKTDPFFLLVRDRVLADGFYNEPYSLSTGVCYEGWCPHFTGKDSRVCRRLVVTKGLSVEVEWGRTIAPIKLQIYRGNVKEDRFFERSLTGMAAALDAAHGLLRESR